MPYKQIKAQVSQMNKVEKKTKGIPDYVDKHVGKRLRMRRSLLGMSQEKLADSVGVTFQQIQKYEHGTNRVSAGRLLKFSEILQVPIDYFYEDLERKRDSLKKPSYEMADNNQEGYDLADNSKLAEKDIFSQKETLDLVRLYYSVKDKKNRKELLKKIKILVEAFQ